ncbi:hypothetical protein NB231_07202 [Nitrococcus mobilis Nb-231]|uniref:Uncharacterized protein n=2 Tax=Nitrococcus mobilis TaxID=35797 RepID=A4BUK0_9GAMM|nr:hypothetical protein NB231_07202 [Nitrococcus mobilis Nb-231]
MLCTLDFAVAQSKSEILLNALSEPERQKLLDTRKELEGLHRQLAEITAAARKNNPSLQGQEDKLRHLVLNTMEAAGYQPEQEMAHLKELTSKLRAESVDPEQKKRLLTDYRQTQARLMAAQREAMANEEVQQARENYQKQVRQAMEKENPDAEALIQRYAKMRMQLRRQLEEAIENQGADH